MRHIGDVMRDLSIPIYTRTGVTSTTKDAPKCPVCRDAGYLRMDAPVGHPNFGRLIQCSCTVEKQEEREAAQLWQLSNLDALDHLTFKQFDPEIDGLREAYDAARDYARHLQGWLFLHGNCGVGKTHLAVAIALAAMERIQRFRPYFSVVPDLLDQLRSTFDPSAGVAYDDRFQQIRNCQLLILDDLGTENTTPWAREKLYQILNFRYNEQRPTIITSNQPLDRIEERILSRISDTRLTRYLWIDAEDFRRQRQRSPSGSPRRG